MSNDKIANVRLDFVKSVLELKPFLDSKSQINTELIEIIYKLKSDTNKEVSEAAENSDFLLLKQREKKF
jgi:hypothetical protein